MEPRLNRRKVCELHRRRPKSIIEYLEWRLDFQ